ncbi:MAG: type IV pilus secretin PilQ [Proteobacteria bacterium]|nr:type IV pilus secretin PilQ [Pseudomonadota bacterium]
MAYIKSKYPWGGLTGILLSAMLLFGCAGNETVKKDPLFDKWSTMGETATGHSPAPRDRGAAFAQQLVGTDLTEETIRELPTQAVNLKLRQADVRTILRALARIVDMNILVKNEIKGEMTIDFRDVPWNQAFNGILRTQGLTYAWEGDVIRVMTLEDADLALKRKVQEQGINWVEPLRTVVIPIDYAKPQDLKENLESLLVRNKEDKPRGSVRVDGHSNSLIISAIRDDIIKMIPIIEAIDKPTPQIQIKANIVETSKDTARDLGIQWGGMTRRGIGNRDLYITPGGSSGSTTPATNPLDGGYTPLYGSSGISDHGFGVNFPAAMTGAASGSLGLMFGALGGNILEMQLNALQKDGKLNILSSPSITTLDNQMAFTENGEKIPYSTLDTSVSPPTRTVKFEDVVLRLEITPHVIDGKNLLMKIIVKKDEVDTSRSVDGNPFIIKKQTVTSLIAKDGETIVISGLTKQRALGGDAGVPWLKDIPVMGWLFKGESKSEKMEEVLIFITPKILQQLSVADAKQAPPAAK